MSGPPSRCEGCGKFASALYRYFAGADYPRPSLWLCSGCHP